MTQEGKAYCEKVKIIQVKLSLVSGEEKGSGWQADHYTDPDTHQVMIEGTIYGQHSSREEGYGGRHRNTD